MPLALTVAAYMVLLAFALVGILAPERSRIAHVGVLVTALFLLIMLLVIRHAG